jgi:hypothetical protein
VSDYDGANRKHIAIARKSDVAIADAKAAFLQHAMGMVDGRIYFYELLTGCGVFLSSVYARSALDTAYNCGTRDVGQQILNDIMRVCPDDYLKMMREANARTITDTVRRARSDEDSRRDNSGPSPVPYIHPAFDTADRNNSAAPADTDYDPFDEARGNED